MVGPIEGVLGPEAVVGLALTVFGLIEAGVRRALGPGQQLEGLQLDPITGTQRRILDLLDASLPWQPSPELALASCGRRG